MSRQISKLDNEEITTSIHNQQEQFHNLKLNIEKRSKTEVVPLSDEDIDLTIDNYILRSKDHIKFLGIYFEIKLNRKKQVEYQRLLAIKIIEE